MEPHGNWLLAAPPCACTVDDLVRALAADGDCDRALLDRVRGALSGRVVEAAAETAAADVPQFGFFDDVPFGALPGALPSRASRPRGGPAARRAPAASSVTQPLAPRRPPPRRRATPAPAPAPADVRAAFTKKTRAALKK